jgi:hypothetical protein
MRMTTTRLRPFAVAWACTTSLENTWPHYQAAGSFEARAKHGNYNAGLHEVGFHR